LGISLGCTGAAGFHPPPDTGTPNGYCGGLGPRSETGVPIDSGKFGCVQAGGGVFPPAGGGGPKDSGVPLGAPLVLDSDSFNARIGNPDAARGIGVQVQHQRRVLRCRAG
jgi:hypothetical protein